MVRGGGRARPLGLRSGGTWEAVLGLEGSGLRKGGGSSRRRRHLEVEGTNEVERSGKRAGLWRRGGDTGKRAGLTRAQRPPGWDEESRGLERELRCGETREE